MGFRTSPDLFELVGDAAQAVGTLAFESALLDLVAGVADHDFLWAVRYAKASETHVFETRFIDERLVEDYKDRYQEDDPFGRHWRRHRRSGVVLSAEVMDDTPSSRRYQREFQQRASINDEIGLLLPLPGDACLGLFLESRSRFDAAQIRALKRAAPTIDVLANAHAMKLSACHSPQHAAVGSPRRDDAILVVDRSGEPVVRNDAWIAAESDWPRLRELVRLHVASETGAIREFGRSLKFERLGESYTLAPGGLAFMLACDATPGPRPGQTPLAGAPSSPTLTRLEQAVLSLVLETRSSGEIAGALSISKATVKKYKMRLYRKYGVQSERQLTAAINKSLS